jgi:hypothetical protein
MAQQTMKALVKREAAKGIWMEEVPVPQIAVFSSLIRTWLGPGVGTGTSSIQMPLVASRFTSARIVFCAIAGKTAV